jgi:hypothetical protein
MINNHKVVCIVGSTKFKKQILSVQKELILNGNIVLGIYWFKDDKKYLSQEQLDGLFNLQLARIKMSDEVFVVNVDGYVGDSTKLELFYAIINNKKIRWLESDKELKNFKISRKNFLNFPAEIRNEIVQKQAETLGDYICAEYL